MKKSRIVSIVIALSIVIFMLTSCGSGGWGDLQPKNEPLSAFNTSCLPLAVPDAASYGSFTFDADGNLLFVVNGAGEIRSLDRNTCTVSTVATGVATGSMLLGMTYSQNSIIVGAENGNIYKVDPTTGSSTVLANVSSSVNGLAIAPTTYSPYGGQLIVATYSGNIYAVDQSVASPTPVLISDIGYAPSALVFGSDGTLYVVSYNSQKIVTVTATGVTADFVTTGLNGPDGLAFDTTGGLLYVSDSGHDTLKSVTIPGGVVSDIASIDFNAGWYPSPIIYDAASNILLMGTYVSGGSMTIDYWDLNL